MRITVRIIQRVIILVIGLAIAGSLILSVAGADRTIITVAGSDTLVLLGQRWAVEYMSLHPEVAIQVLGGGSGTGINALINGTADICEASRSLNDSELVRAAQNGVDPHQLTVALDGVTVYLNSRNRVTELSIDQLSDIYTGVLTDWAQLGGEPGEIVLYGRENNSGTYALLKKRVLNDQPYSEKVQSLPGTAAMVNAVARDLHGIGYGGLSWASGVKYAAIRKDSLSSAVWPNDTTILSGEYPITRELFWFFNGEPQGAVQGFVNWALSEKGQKVARDLGYVALPKPSIPFNPNPPKR